jgi:hypothetical protein
LIREIDKDQRRKEFTWQEWREQEEQEVGRRNEEK